MDKKVKWIQVRISIPDYEKIKIYVKKHGITISECVRKMLEKDLKQ